MKTRLEHFAEYLAEFTLLDEKAVLKVIDDYEKQEDVAITIVKNPKED